MAKCKNCGQTYFSRECHCYGKKDNENIQVNKKTLLIVIAIAVTIIAFIMIKKEYEEYQAVQTVKKMFYGTTDNDKIEKINNEMINQTNDIMKQTNEMFKNMNETTNQMMKRNNQLIENMNKK